MTLIRSTPRMFVQVVCMIIVVCPFLKCSLLDEDNGDNEKKPIWPVTIAEYEHLFANACPKSSVL